MHNYTFIDLFAGIGGLRLAMEAAGGTCVYSNEWNKFAKKTYEANFGEIPDDDITKVEANTIPDHDVLMGGFPCLAMGTPVLTEHGHMAIDDITPGTKVLGHDGKWHVVQAVMNNGVRETYSIDAFGTTSLRATLNHRLYARRKIDADKTNGIMTRTFGDPEWVDVATIMESPKEWYLASPILDIETSLPEWGGVTVRQNKTKSVTKRDIDVSFEGFWYLAGRYLGDGWLAKNYKKGKNRSPYRGVIIACGRHKAEKFEDKLNFYGFKYTVAHERTVDKYIFSSVELATFFETFFGSKADRKRIDGSIMALPDDLLELLIEGYVDSDGCPLNTAANSIQISSINNELLLDMAFCIEKVYKTPCAMRMVDIPKLDHEIEGRKVNANTLYRLIFDMSPTERKHSFIENGMVWKPVHAVRKSMDTTVYDLAVEGCHSYVSSHCISHNCQPFSISGVSKKRSLGRATGFEDETQGTLFFDVCRILAEKRPKAFFLENVKNLTSHDRGNTFRVIRSAIDELDYDLHYAILDAQDYVPQHRERIVMVGFDRRRYGNVDFHVTQRPPEAKPCLMDILDDDVPDKYTLSDHLWQYLQDYAAKHRAAGHGFGYGLAPLDGITRTLSARYYKDGSEILVPQDGRNPRRLTPRECARLQGFPESFKIPVSDTQAYRQFGNSVCVPLMTDVARSIVAKLEELDNG